MTEHFEEDFQTISNGYSIKNSMISCNFCETVYFLEKVYPIGNEFYNAAGAMKEHLFLKHNGVFNGLLQKGAKSFGLTTIQLEILHAFNKGLTDAQTADLFNITQATVRNYRFKFKEKKEQALHYLALMKTLEHQKGSDKMGIQAFDKRFNISTEDREKTLKILSNQIPRKLDKCLEKKKQKSFYYTI